jgi:hypothetical protein
MALPTPPLYSNPIPNPSPTIPDGPQEYIVKGPYWNMKIADAGISVNAGGQILRTGSGTSYPTASTAQIKSSTGYFDIGNGLSVVNGNNFQVGTGAGTRGYYVETSQGWLILGNGFAVNSDSGELELD